MVNLSASESSPAGRAADLGWLLQNTQASNEEICTFLLDILRGEMERLTAAFLRSPADTITVIEEAAAWAVANRKQYHSEVSGKAWLFEHIVQECDKDVYHFML